MTPRLIRTLLLSSSVLIVGAPALAQSDTTGTEATQPDQTMMVTGTSGTELNAEVLSSFDDAWAMAFLPDGRALVTEKGGDLWLLGPDGAKLGKITGTPEVSPRGQGGLGDIVVHPDFAGNSTVFISYVERDASDDSLSGAVVEKATLELTEEGGQLSDRAKIWSQSQKVPGNGHYGHRIAVAPDGNLIITSGERQKFSPAQNMGLNLGKVIRVTTGEIGRASCRERV